MGVFMICGYLPCDRDAEISKITGKLKKYCCDEHAVNETTRTKKERASKRKESLGLKNLNQVNIGRNVAEEVRIENVKHIEQALQGDSTAQEALKNQGLTYHYRRGGGEWGMERGDNEPDRQRVG